MLTVIVVQTLLVLAFIPVDVQARLLTTAMVESSNGGERLRPPGVSVASLEGVRTPPSLRLEVPVLTAPVLDLPVGLFSPEHDEESQLFMITWLAEFGTLGRPVMEEVVVFSRVGDLGACVGPLPHSPEELFSLAPRVVMSLARPRDGGPVARFAADHPAADMARMTNCLRATFRGLQLGSTSGP